MFGEQQPQSQVSAAKLVGQQLADAAFEATGVGWFGAGMGTAAVRVQLQFSMGEATVEFFFEGRSER